MSMAYFFICSSLDSLIIIVSIPMMAFIGFFISLDILAKNSDLVLFAFSSICSARSSASVFSRSSCETTSSCLPVSFLLCDHKAPCTMEITINTIKVNTIRVKYSKNPTVSNNSFSFEKTYVCLDNSLPRSSSTLITKS